MRTRGFGPLKGGASVLALSLGLASAQAWAGGLPSHGRFAEGRGRIDRDAAGGRLTVDQSSRTGIVDWRNFSIGRTDSVVFDNGRGATLNEVQGGNLSRIAGELHATGSVYLLNRAGVVVTNAGRIDTQGSFVASSRGAEQDAFAGGHGLRLTGHVRGNVINSGRIASGASVTLFGRDTVAGRITAKGRVETSGSHVRLAGASVRARSWVIDPQNLTVNASTAATLDSSLNQGMNVTLKTTKTTASGPGSKTSGPGDITVAAPISWSGTALLTLEAYHSVMVNAAMTAKSGGRVAVTFNYSGGTGGNLFFGAGDTVTFDKLSSTFSLNGKPYKLVKDLATLASDIASNPANRYALAADVDASGTTYSQPPIMTTFGGTFEGLGHTISNLKIVDLTDSFVGLFSTVSGNLRDVGFVSANVSGLFDNANVGVLVGNTIGNVFGAHANGAVSAGIHSAAGGLIGSSLGPVTNSFASVSVTAGNNSYDLGGLIGYSAGPVTNSHATGDVSGGTGVSAGGLIGDTDNGNSITGSYAKGDVTGGHDSSAGGLVGYSDTDGDITSSYATGTIFGGGGGRAGGLVGAIESIGVISKSHATGDVSNDNGDAGGLAGQDYAGSVQSSYATGNVSGGNASSGAGGLIGNSGGISITGSYATGSVSGGENSDVGGLIGKSQDTVIKSSHASGHASTGDGATVGSALVGGLVGYEKGGSIASSHATGGVSGSDDAFSGGLVGEVDSSATVNGSYATGNVFAGEAGFVGGLFGYLASGMVTKSHATGDVNSSGVNALVGGLGGANYGTVGKSYATGDVSTESGSASDVGGLVGFNGGTIGQTFATGMVTGGFANAGGLVGNNNSLIRDSYATGDVSGLDDSQVGGFAGSNGGTIDTSYSTGRVLMDSSAGSHLGGFVGYDNAGTYSDDYWNKTTAGTNIASGFGSVTGVTGYFTSVFQGKSLATLGFDPSIWAKTAGVNGGLPYLKNNPPH